MLKFRMMFGLTALVLVLALAQTGFAQLSISATNTPNPTANATGFNEPTNDPTQNVGMVITGTILSDAPFTGGLLRLTFPSAITNGCTVKSSTSSTGCAGITTAGGAGSVNGPGNSPIQLTLATGIFTGAQVAQINAAAGRVDILLPCSAGPTVNAFTNAIGASATMTGLTGTMILQGVRIDATAVSSFPASATLSLPGGSSTYPGIGAVSFGAGKFTGTECTTTNGSPTNVTLNTSTVAVITASAAGIGAVASGGLPSTVTSGSAANFNAIGVTGCPTGYYANCGTATVYTNRSVQGSGQASFNVKEGFTYAWYNNDATQFSGLDLTTAAVGSAALIPAGSPAAAGCSAAAYGAFSACTAFTTNQSSMLLTFNNLPAGVTLTLAVNSWTSGSPTFTTGATATITTANNTASVVWGGDLSTSGTAWVEFRITGISVPTTGTLSNAAVTVSASMRPTATSSLNLTAGTGSAAVITTAFPEFASATVGNATVLNIVPANTTMLVPFAVTAGTYDTGIALANTSLDPFNIGTLPQSGSVTVTLYPQTPAGTATGAGATVTGQTFTTSATKLAGTGIAADGTVAAGSTWTVNLSQLLPLAGVTGSFEGYIFIQANFLPAHGVAYIYNGTGFTSATPMLVMAPPSTNGRAGNFTNGAESLEF